MGADPTNTTPPPSDRTADTAQPVELADLPATNVTGPARKLTTLSKVALEVTVELGKVRMPIRDLLALQEGTVLELDRLAGAPVDIRANGEIIAYGDVVVVGDELGVRVRQLAEGQ